MRLLLILAAFFIASCGGKKCDCEEILKLSNPDITKPPERIRDTEPRKNLIVSIAGDNKIYVGKNELPKLQLDSLLGIELNKIRKDSYDTVTLVIQADSTADYGVVFDLMRIAKKQKAKVVANIETR